MPSEIGKLPPGPPVRGFPGVWKLSLLRLPSQDGSPSLALLSLFIFYILSYLLSKTMGCFSGCLMSSASDQKLFCEICSALNCSFHEFVGEKVVSPAYSSTILAPPPNRSYFKLEWCYHEMTNPLIQFSSVTHSCPTRCSPMDCSMPGFPVHHQLPELAQTHVHQLSNAIQPSDTPSVPSPPIFNICQPQGLF